MKSNYKRKIIQPKDVEKAVEIEYNKRIDELYEQVKSDVVAQIMAVCCYDLNKEFGFGRERIQRFVSGVSSYFEIMLTEGVLGQPFTTQNCIDFLMREYGIDIVRGGN